MKTLITPAEADRRILRLREGFPSEELPLLGVPGRILREEIRADQDFPPFDRVMMDGIAVRFSDFQAGHRAFEITGMAPAGQPSTLLPSTPSSAIEVMTGAVLPIGSDCILPVEWYDIENGRAILRDDAAPQEGVFIHRQGRRRKNAPDWSVRGLRPGNSAGGIFRCQGSAFDQSRPAAHGLSAAGGRHQKLLGHPRVRHLSQASLDWHG